MTNWKMAISELSGTAIRFGTAMARGDTSQPTPPEQPTIRLIEEVIDQARKEERQKVLDLPALNNFVVGCASAKREDLGTPKADPDSGYNKRYADGKNAKAAELRQQIEEMK